MKRLTILCVVLAFFAAMSDAQQRKTTTKKKATTTRVVKKKVTGTQAINNLKNQRAQIKKNIKRQQERFKENERNVKTRLQNLIALNTEIDHKKQLIDSIKLEIDTLNMEIKKLDGELVQLKAELADRKDKYVRSIRYMHRNSSVQNQLMFVFSAKNFTQMYRRMRFMREYAGYQRTQGEMVKAKQVEVKNKQDELKATKDTKDRLLKRGEEEHKNLEAKQEEQQKMVKNLQNQQKTIKGIIAEQQKKDAQLNAEIERLIAIEIEKARKRAEEEARRKAEEEARKAREAAARNGKKVNKQLQKTVKKSTPYRIDAEDRRISGSFVSNKGRLPVPVVGPYRIINRFGQYNVEGLKNVRLDNKGILIQAPGAQVRSIFDGEVSAVFSLMGITGVMIRHGSYISVYCNLTGITVRKGDRVTTRQVIGRIDGGNVLEFQLRNEKRTLNPEAWIAR